MGLQELENLGVGESSEDVIVGIWIKGTERYTLAAATTQTIIRDFVEVWSVCVCVFVCAGVYPGFREGGCRRNSAHA